MRAYAQKQHSSQAAPEQAPGFSKAPRGLQRKAAIRPPLDACEHEADRFAAWVVNLAAPVRGNVQPSGTAAVPASASTHESAVARTLQGVGQPLDNATRAFMEPRFGQDFTRVRVHTDEQAARSARAADALAYTVGEHVVFGAGQFRPDATDGRRLLAHELTHVMQQRKAGVSGLQRYGTPIPKVDYSLSMADYIALVRRIEAANPGMLALQIAQMIMRTKYHSGGWDYLLPSSAGGKQVGTGSGATTKETTALEGEFDVALPQGGTMDASHVLVAIVAQAETKSPGAGGAGGWGGKTIGALPKGVSVRDVTTWVGDVASAAAEWTTVHPHPSGGFTMQAYMDEFAPESDLIGDIDGIAMAASRPATGFVFDHTASLSSNLDRFYFPTAAREGKNRRFHTFCAVEGFGVEPATQTLDAAAVTAIDERVRLNADWFEKNDPNLLTWITLSSGGMFNPIPSEWVKRASDWKWFSAKFREFVNRNLKAEGS